MKSELPNLKRHFQYKKFKSPPYRFLFLKYDYFLQNQLLAELRHRGHQAIELALPEHTPAKDALRLILEEAVKLRPDALLVLNNMGLDHQGTIIGVLARLPLPVILWYLDNYRFTGPHAIDEIPESVVAFSSDKALLPTLNQAGFPYAFYLPLATDITYSKVKHDNRFKFLRNKVSYVGGTFVKMIRHFHHDVYETLYSEWQPDFSTMKMEIGHIDLDTVFAPYRERFTTLDAFYNFIAYVVFRETRRYRVGRLTTLLDEPLVVYGIDDWKNYLPEEVVRSPVAYALETPNVYLNSAVNLSLTTFQQETALNQRLFDVPMCNGFVLTDWQESLADHFELDEEVVYFHNDEELKDKVRYFLEHPAARDRVIQKARERIWREHLMEHRVTTMLDLTRKTCA
ncbi:MAG: glycosyltransferase [Fidelibacterota bacterium]|nr:MAG: glycosyltransferase [Candidatus Neomarinimicrobiota bacterium]